jgi:hypothetical protein
MCHLRRELVKQDQGIRKKRVCTSREKETRSSESLRDMNDRVDKSRGIPQGPSFVDRVLICSLVTVFRMFVSRLTIKLDRLMIVSNQALPAGFCMYH